MDRRTLFSMQAGLLLFLGCVILLAFRKQRKERNDRGGLWFGIGYLCAGIGLGLQAERGLLPPVLTIVLGNALFMLFSAFANRSVVETTRQGRGEFLSLLALNAVTTANYAYFTYCRPNVLLRTIEAVFVVALMNGSVVVRLLRAKDDVVRPALRALALLLGLQSASGFVRVTMAWKLRQADAWFSAIGIVTIAGVALAFLWIDGLRLQNDLEQNAMTDPLTGLFNRRGLDVLAARALRQAVRNNAFCSALMIDVDHFKRINDHHGHAAGDACLSAIARVLRDSLKSCDIATRLGGDEFFVLLPELAMESVAPVMERLHVAFQQLRVSGTHGERFAPGVSIGHVTRHAAHTSLSELLHASDLSLYRQKQARDAGDLSPREEGLLQTLYGAQVQPSLA